MPKTPQSQVLIGRGRPHRPHRRHRTDPTRHRLPNRRAAAGAAAVRESRWCNHVRSKSSRPWACCRAGEDTWPADVERFEHAAESVVATAAGDVNVYLIAAPGADVAATVLPVIHDAESEFAGAYATGGRTTFVVRPYGYLGFAGGEEVEALVVHLRATFG